MIFLKKHWPILLLCIAIVSGASSAFAIDDGLNYGKKAGGKYVDVYYAPGLDAAQLSPQLNIRSSDEILTGQSMKSTNSNEVDLARMLDTLFLKVSDILDMHLYSLKMTIKICKTVTELNDVYEHLFNASLGGRRSFYVYDLNSIYVSGEAFQAGIIGHEMSHAIISHYFANPAPVKVQEVLAMYVEYNLKK